MCAWPTASIGYSGRGTWRRSPPPRGLLEAGVPYTGLRLGALVVVAMLMGGVLFGVLGRCGAQREAGSYGQGGDDRRGWQCKEPRGIEPFRVDIRARRAVAGHACVRPRGDRPTRWRDFTRLARPTSSHESSLSARENTTTSTGGNDAKSDKLQAIWTDHQHRRSAAPTRRSQQAAQAVSALPLPRVR